MDFEALRIESDPVDAVLTQAVHVETGLADAMQRYLSTPRALVWHQPSPDWRLLVVLLPLSGRWSRLTNPILGQLVRDWGHALRFIGVDRTHAVYDFRALLTQRTLHRLIASLDADATDSNATLDVLFAALGANMLTLLDARRADWGRHLARESRLEPLVTDSVFDRAARYPEFTAQLHRALRTGAIDMGVYGRLLRSMDTRETQAECRIAALIASALDPATLALLNRTRSGQHLGCYNWLHSDPQHARQRAYVLSRLPVLAHCFAEALIDVAPRRQTLLLAAAAAQNHLGRVDAATRAALRQAIDSGQDRLIIPALAAYFGVQAQVIRNLWRFCPPGLGAPASWHVRQILHRLDQLPDRTWPRDDAGWQALAGHAIPALAH